MHIHTDPIPSPASPEAGYGAARSTLAAFSYWQLHALARFRASAGGDFPERIRRAWTLQADWIFRASDSTERDAQAFFSRLQRTHGV